MTTKIETLEAALRNALGSQIQSLTVALGEVTVVVGASDYLSAMRVLRDHADLRFEELIDLCGVDYSTYGDGAWDGRRFAAACACFCSGRRAAGSAFGHRDLAFRELV
jgi:NADH-quinone oxidoreductase subunit C